MFLHLSVILFTGGCLPAPWADTLPWADPPGRHTPGRHPLGRHPPGQTSPLGRHPPWADTPHAQTCWDTPTPAQCMLGYTPLLRRACWDTVNKRAVSILLECILVEIVFTFKRHPTGTSNTADFFEDDSLFTSCHIFKLFQYSSY